MVNPAPAHLEAKLRFLDFTVGQIAAIFGGALLGVAWAAFVCPFDGLPAAISGVYFGALPAMPVFLASQTDFDLWLVVRGAAGWRRADGRYVPGPGATCRGYRTEAIEHAAGEGHAFELNLHALWDEA